MSLKDISEQFASSRQQAGLSKNYIDLCRRYTRMLAEGFPGLCLTDLTTALLDKWLGNLKIKEKCLTASDSWLYEDCAVTGFLQKPFEVGMVATMLKAAY